MSIDADERDEESTCIDCGATLWPEVDRTFSPGPDAFLCFACAEKRGGVYDADRDRWVEPPDTRDLPDERRPHA